MITIIDYGLGNIQAFVNVYRRLHIPVVVAKTAEDLADVTKLILPGVGSFDHAIQLLNRSGMRERIEQLVIVDQIPVLGICVGMQLLADSSDEGNLPGLGWIPGTVRSFKSLPSLVDLPVPHMGWNDVKGDVDSRLFAGMEDGSRFYFLHSYYFECASNNNHAAMSHYGTDFSCAVYNRHIYGVQFHPEKSHHHGVLLLQNFAEL
jgi:glutamine amidotransferase